MKPQQAKKIIRWKGSSNNNYNYCNPRNVVSLHVKKSFFVMGYRLKGSDNGKKEQSIDGNYLSTKIFVPESMFDMKILVLEAAGWSYELPRLLHFKESYKAFLLQNKIKKVSTEFDVAVCLV